LVCAVFEKFEPVIVEKEKIVEKTIEVNKLNPEDQAILAYGKKQMKERRESMQKGIQANTVEGIWTDEVLNVMNEDTLERVFNSVKKEEIAEKRKKLNLKKKRKNNKSFKPNYSNYFMPV